MELFIFVSFEKKKRGGEKILIIAHRALSQQNKTGGKKGGEGRAGEGGVMGEGRGGVFTPVH